MTTLLDATGDPPPDVAVAAAVAALARGEVVGLPTDTVYGLAADPWVAGASDKLFLVKDRPRNVELPVFVAGADQALELTADLPPAARRLMASCWPGPLTIVMPRRQGLGADLGQDEATIGLRCPDHPVPLALAREYGPFATTSANRHGQPPVTEAPVLAAELTGVALVLDAGPCDGTPSTVVDVCGDELRLLREGTLAWADVRRVAGVT